MKRFILLKDGEGKISMGKKKKSQRGVGGPANRQRKSWWGWSGAGLRNRRTVTEKIRTIERDSKGIHLISVVSYNQKSYVCDFLF